MRSLLRRPVLAALALCACVGLVSVPASAGPGDRLQQIHRRQAELRDKYRAADSAVAALSERIEEVDARRDLLKSKVAGLDEKLSELDVRISVYKGRLEAAQREMALLTERIQVVLERLQKRRELLVTRAVAAYEAGPTAYVDGLLSSDSFADLVDRFQYYQSAMHADTVLIDQIGALRSSLEAQRSEVERKQEQIAAAKQALDGTRARVASTRAQKAEALREQQAALSEKQALLRQARAKKERYQQVLDRLDRQSEHIQEILQQQSSAGSAAPGPGDLGGGRLMWPCSGPLTSLFGWRVDPVLGGRRLHAGIDLGCAYGSPVYAADSGTVVFVGQITGYGNVVMVDHGGGMATTYNHLSSFSVSVGEHVGRGDQVASVGSTGYSTGPHLHFEVRINGAPTDPLPYLQ
jgi:murein DD-endopeptidase MepM/ murein hydrolase activator NlpD